MTEMIGSPDFGNSPKNEFVQDIVIYGAGWAVQFGAADSYLAAALLHKSSGGGFTLRIHAVARAA